MEPERAERENTVHAIWAYIERRRIEVLEAEVDPLNQASSRVLEILGFTREGLLRKRWIDKGAAHDTIIYGLLSDEWHTSRRVSHDDVNGNSTGRFGPP